MHGFVHFGARLNMGVSQTPFWSWKKFNSWNYWKRQPPQETIICDDGTWVELPARNIKGSDRLQLILSAFHANLFAVMKDKSVNWFFFCSPANRSKEVNVLRHTSDFALSFSNELRNTLCHPGAGFPYVAAVLPLLKGKDSNLWRICFATALCHHASFLNKGCQDCTIRWILREFLDKADP